MKPVDFGMKDASLVAMYSVGTHEYLLIEGFDREDVIVRFTISVVTWEKLNSEYKDKRAEVEDEDAEMVRQSLDEPVPTDELGHELPEEIH